MSNSEIAANSSPNEGRERTKRVRRTTPVKAYSVIEPEKHFQRIAFDTTYKFIVGLQTRLLGQYFRAQPGLAGFTFPRYYQYSFYKPNRSPHEFDAAFEAVKQLALHSGFRPHSTLTNAFTHTVEPKLYFYIKKYTQANVLGVYVIRYYGENDIQTTDLR